MKKQLRENPRSHGSIGMAEIREMTVVLQEEHGYEFEEDGSDVDLMDDVFDALFDAGLALVAAVRGRLSLTARLIGSDWAIVPSEMVNLMEGRYPRPAEEDIFDGYCPLERPLVAL